MSDEILSHTQIQSQVQALLNPGDTYEKWTREVWSDRVVYEDADTGRLYQQSITVADGSVELTGEPVEVRVTYTPL